MHFDCFVSCYFFNCSVIEFMARDERFGLKQNHPLFFLLKISDEGSTEIFRNIFCVAFLKMVSFILGSKEFFLEDKFLLFWKHAAIWDRNIICILGTFTKSCVGSGGSIIREFFFIWYGLKHILVLYCDNFILKLYLSKLDQFLPIILANGIENPNLVVLIIFLFFPKTLNILIGTVPFVKIKQFFRFCDSTHNIFIKIHVFSL